MLFTSGISNIKDCGATGDGKSDDTKPIQRAIDLAAENGGGTLFFPKGTYIISESLIKKANVNLVGETMFTTAFEWIGNKPGVILDTSNQSLKGTLIENFTFTKAPEVKENVTGILGGSKMTSYNSSLGSFKNLNFSNIDYGIRGNAEQNGVGIFDCCFENIFCSNCFRGIWLFGSGNTIVHLKIMSCSEGGLILDWLDEESYDGVHVIGGIFVRNKCDVLIPNTNGIRPCNFVGTWFEQSEDGIIHIPNQGTRVMNLTFRDCMLNTSAKKSAMFNVENAKGTVCVDNCTIVQHIQEGRIDFINPVDHESKLVIRNAQGYKVDGTPFTINN